MIDQYRYISVVWHSPSVAAVISVEHGMLPRPWAAAPGK